jgi:uncharacterized protein
MRISAAIFLFIIIAWAPAAAQESRESGAPFAPWNFSRGVEAAAGRSETESMSPGAKALTWTVRFYQETVSQVNGERCMMYPSCSAYSLETIRKHGFFLGYVMTADRLIHESNEMDSAPKVRLKNGKEKYYDPVEANDFWWSGKRTEKQDVK